MDRVGVLHARKLIALSATSLLLAGCAVGPDYHTPSRDFPARWHGTKAVSVEARPNLGQWWRQLNDPILNALIEEAVAGNLDVATAKAKIREARATRQEAVGGLFPDVSGSGSVSRSRVGATSSSGMGANTTGNQFQAGFDSSWELDIFGANHRQLEAAGYGVDASEENLRSTLVTLIGDVASSYVEARAYQARIGLARRTAASQREAAKLTRKMLEAGSATAVDVAKADAQASSTEANIPTYEQLYAEDVHKLAVLLGREPGALAKLMQRSQPIPSPRRNLPVGIPADTLLTRPDVRYAERQLAQATAKIGQAQAALYPSVSLTGSLSTSGVKVGDLAKNSSISWSFGPSLSVPIFNGGQLRAEVEAQQARRDQNYIAFRAAVLNALQDVENSMVSLAQERTKAGRLAGAASSYREAARLSLTLYQNGSVTFLDVLDAQRSAYSAEDTLLQSRQAIATDYIALAKALGGGWDGDVVTSKPEIVDADTGPHLRQ